MTLLSKDYIKSTQREIIRLRKQKAIIDAELGRLENLVKGDAHTPRPDDGASLDGSIEKKNGKGTDSVEPGFKNRVLEVLRGTPKGLRPMDVTNALRESGFELNGKTALSMRVAGELARMKRAKQLRRTRGGFYKVPESLN